MGVNKTDDKTDPPKKKVIIPDESTYLESSAAASGIDLEAISKKDRIKITNKDRTHLIQELNRVWSSMAQFGGGPLGEESMTAPELREENQATRDQHEHGHSDGKKVIHKERSRVPRFKTKLEELIWIAEQKEKK